MQILRFALRNLWRDLKSGELSVLLLALSVAVLSLMAPLLKKGFLVLVKRA
jgi:predicted lysophospholipase L1 biosynthesis ABC-type transport system permease subunit